MVIYRLGKAFYCKTKHIHEPTLKYATNRGICRQHDLQPTKLNDVVTKFQPDGD